MSAPEMTSLQRVLTTLGHQEPDRVPYIFSFTIGGARELGLSIKDYFSQPRYVAEGQMRLRAKYGHDGLLGFFYTAVELEAWGGTVVYYEDGPPNAGEPLLKNPEDFLSLDSPVVDDIPILRKVLETISLLRERAGKDVPVIAGVTSPFSLPILQLGFERYLEILQDRHDLVRSILRLNEEFCVAWANAQLAAGATAIGYANPLASSSMVPLSLYRQLGLPSDRRTLARIQGGVAMNLASSPVLPVLEDLAQTGAAGIGASALEDLAIMKARCKGRMAILGNLNGIAMRHWTPQQAEAEVKKAIALAGPGGGFVLSDNHGEIPWQVPEEVLMAISEAVHTWGRYPLNWVGETLKNAS